MRGPRIGPRLLLLLLFQLLVSPQCHSVRSDAEGAGRYVRCWLHRCRGIGRPRRIGALRCADSVHRLWLPLWVRLVARAIRATRH